MNNLLKYFNSLFLVCLLLLLCGCSNKSIDSKQLKYELGNYDFVVEVPKYENYEIRNGFDDVNDKMGPLLSSFNLVGDKLRIEFVEYNCDFLNYEKFIKKYGPNLQKSWDNYKKYLFDKDFFNISELKTKTIKVNGVEGVEYRVKYKSDEIDLIMRTLNTDNVISNYYINMYIFSNNDKPIENLVKEEDVRIILDSIKFIKK